MTDSVARTRTAGDRRHWRDLRRYRSARRLARLRSRAAQYGTGATSSAIFGSYEVCYLLQVRLGAGAETDFLTALSRQEFDLIPLTSKDFARAAELVRKYSDLPLGAVDASVIAVAERLGDCDIATTDRRHFYAVREARDFTLHPAV